MMSDTAPRPAAWLALVGVLLVAGCGEPVGGSGPERPAEAGTTKPATAVPVAAATPEPLERTALTLPAATAVARPTRLPEAVPDANGVFTGAGEAVEGDVLTIGRTRFLLYGIDTVEPAQTCSINGQPWECWPAVVRAIETILGEGGVSCTPTGGTRDPFGRILAACEVNGESVNERMVRSGYAIAVAEEMPEYAAAEATAQALGVGLWQGNFEDPAAWRAGRGILLRRP